MVLRGLADPRSIRGRLALGYAGALFIALVVFAIASLVAIDRVQRAMLLHELAVGVDAGRAIVDLKAGRISMDAKDRAQFASVASGRFNAAVIAANGTLIGSTGTSLLPTTLRRRLGRDATLDDADFAAAIGVLRYKDNRLGTIVVWHGSGAILAVDRAIALAYTALIPALVLVAYVAGILVAGRGLQPLDDLARSAAKIEGDDLSRRLRETAHDPQLRRLGTTLNRMLERLEAAFARQQRFTNDASHDLRSPITVIAAEAELALRRSRSPQEYRNALDAIASEARRLEELVGQLLTIARAESGGTTTSAIDVGEIAAPAIARFDSVARERGMTLRAELARDCRVRIDAGDLSCVVATLVHNATQYGRSGGTIVVTLQRCEQSIELVVSDDGPGFSAAALEHALDRFWRDDAARGRTGSGLGLAIVHAIVRNASGSVILANETSGGGARVIARFPAQASTCDRPPEKALHVLAK